MTIWRKSFASVLLIIAMIGLALLFLRTSATPPQTIVQGKPLSAWVRDLGNPNLESTNSTHAREVLTQQPPSIIPELAHWQSSSIRAPFENLFDKFRRITGLPGQPFNPGSARGELLFVISGIAQKNNLAFDRRPEFQACVDELLREMKSDPANANFYFAVIGQFGVNATNALPAMIASLPPTFSRTNFPQVAMLLHSIAEIGAGPYAQQVIPAATNLLSSSDHIYIALRALGSCGTNAQPFVPQIVEILKTRKDLARPAFAALAQIGPLPNELKPVLAEQMERGSGSASGAAAVAMLQIDPKEPTASNIVQARLHPLSGGDHIEMIQLVSRVPSVAKLFIPDLEKLAKKTNEPTAHLARQILRQTAEKPF